MHDNKIDAPLSTHTHLGFKHGSYASDCYALAVSSLCDEEEPLSFDEAKNSENWLVAMQNEYDAIMKNGTWSLCDLQVGKRPLDVSGFSS